MTTTTYSQRYLKAFAATMAHEGGYSNDPNVIEDALRRALYMESHKNTTTKPSWNEHNQRTYSCSVVGCTSPGYAKGYCNAHWIRFRRGKDMTLPVRNRKQGFSCIECGKPCEAHGGWLRCKTHFKRRRTFVLKTAAVEVMGGCCSKCKGVFPLAVYDFHHIGKKDEAPSWLLGNRSIKTAAQELAKCVLLCANCHREEHAIYD